MPTSAALLLCAQERYDDAATFAASQYWMGVRDAFESVFRGLHELRTGEEVGDNAVACARRVLDQLDQQAVAQLMTESMACLRAKRAFSLDERIKLVPPMATG